MKARCLVVCLLALGVVAFAAPQTAATSPAEVQLAEHAFAGNLDEVTRLVSSGTKVDSVDGEEHTPLMWAAFNGHAAVVSYLLEAGAAVDARDVNGRTALMYAASGPFPETVELLLDKGAEVNAAGTLEGFTALMMAAAEGQAEVVRLLLERGADPGIQDEDGDTAASFARQNGHTAVVGLLESPDDG